MLAFIVFGWGGGRRKDHGAAVPATCPNCGNAVMFHYFSVTKWFSLFFIPLIPYMTQHFLLCPVCTRGFEMNGEKVTKAKQLIESTAAFNAGTLSQVDYEREVQSFYGMLGQAPPSHQLTTEPQRPAIPPPPSAMPPPPTTPQPPDQA